MKIPFNQIFNNLLKIEVELENCTKQLYGIVINEKLIVFMQGFRFGLMVDYYTTEKIQTDDDKKNEEKKKEELINSLKSIIENKQESNESKNEFDGDTKNFFENLEKKMDSLVNNIMDTQLDSLFSKKISKSFFEQIMNNKEDIDLTDKNYQLVKYQIFLKSTDNDYYQDREELGKIQKIKVDNV